MHTFLIARIKHQAETYFRTERTARLLTFAAFLSIFIGLMSGMYVLFLHGYEYIEKQAHLTAALSLFTYELAFLVIGLLVFVSALIASIARLFDQETDAIALSMPRYRLVYLGHVVEVIASSLWPIVVIGIPSIVASINVFHLSFVDSIFELVMLMLAGVVAAFSAVIAVLGVLAVTYFAFGRALRVVATLMIAGACALSGAIMLHEMHGTGQVAQYVFERSSLTGDLDPLLVAQRYTKYPSHVLAEVFFAAQYNEIQPLVIQSVYIGIASVLEMFILWLLSFVYLAVWQDLEMKGTRLPLLSHIMSIRISFGSSPSMALAKKELLLLIRNTRTILWFGFVLLLWLMQVSFDMLIRHDSFLSATTVNSISATIQSFQVVVIVYFISMFILRFVFPSFSAEKDTAWLIGSVPVSYRSMFGVRLLAFSGLFVVLAGIVTTIHASILGLSVITTLVLLTLTMGMSAVLSLYGLTLGVVYPNFETSDPELLSTSLPGLIFIGGAVVYGIFGALSFRYFLLSNDLVPFFGFVAVSMVFYALLRMWAMRALDTFEFAIIA